MTLEPKPNNCKIDFKCTSQADCVYRVGKRKCKYLFVRSCQSKSAQENALALIVKKEMGEK